MTMSKVVHQNVLNPIFQNDYAENPWPGGRGEWDSSGKQQARFANEGVSYIRLRLHGLSYAIQLELNFDSHTLKCGR